MKVLHKPMNKGASTKLWAYSKFNNATKNGLQLIFCEQVGTFDGGFINLQLINNSSALCLTHCKNFIQGLNVSFFGGEKLT